MSSETTLEGRYRFVVRMRVDTSCVWKNVTHTGTPPWTSVTLCRPGLLRLCLQMMGKHELTEAFCTTTAINLVFFISRQFGQHTIGLASRRSLQPGARAGDPARARPCGDSQGWNRTRGLLRAARPSLWSDAGDSVLLSAPPRRQRRQDRYLGLPRAAVSRYPFAEFLAVRAFAPCHGGHAARWAAQAIAGHAGGLWSPPYGRSSPSRQAATTLPWAGKMSRCMCSTVC